MFYKSKPIEYQEWLPWAHVVGNEDDRVAMEFHDLALLKANLVKQQKQIAYDLLFKSDWKVVRAQELGTTVPENITTYRAAVRSAADARCTQINAASSVEDLKTLNLFLYLYFYYLLHVFFHFHHLFDAVLTLHSLYFQNLYYY